MITPELRQFVAQATAAGQSVDEIREHLRAQGWESLDVEQALAQVGQAPIAPAPVGKFPTAFRIVADGWKHYRVRIKALLLLAAIASVAGAASQWLGFGRLYTEDLWGTAKATPSYPGGALAQVASFVASLVNIYVAYAAIIVLVRPDSISAKQALLETRSKALPLLWVTVLAGIASFGGYILLIVPGFIFTMWFSFSVYAYLVDDARGLNALRMSKEYVRGYFWRLWWVYLVIGITVLLAYLMAQGIFGSIGLVRGPVGALAVYLALVFTSLASLFAVSSGYQAFMAIRSRKGALTDVPRATAPIVLGIIGCVILVPLLIAGGIFAALKGRSALQSNLSGFGSQEEIQKVFEFAAARAAVEAYHDEEGSYPATLGELGSDYLNRQLVDVSKFTYTSTGATYRICATIGGQETCESPDDDSTPTAGAQ